MPLPRGPLNEALRAPACSSAPKPSNTARPTETRVGAMLGIKEYPTPTVGGHVRPAAVGALSFVLTQSFAFLSKATGQGLLQRSSTAWPMPAISRSRRRRNSRMRSMPDQQRIRHGRSSFLAAGAGRRADGLPGERPSAGRLKPLNDHVALARSLLADTGMMVAREDLALEAAFWAQLPGNFRSGRARRRSPRAIFAAMAPFHNYPAAARTAITGAKR